MSTIRQKDFLILAYHICIAVAAVNDGLSLASTITFRPVITPYRYG